MLVGGWTHELLHVGGLQPDEPLQLLILHLGSLETSILTASDSSPARGIASRSVRRIL